MPAAQAGASLAAHGVDFVNEDDAGVVFLGFVEQVPHTGGAHAHKHLHKVRAGDGEEGHPGLSGHGPGQQGFTGTGRAHQQHAFGDSGAQGVVLRGVLQKLHNLPQLFLLLIGAGRTSAKVVLRFSSLICLILALPKFICLSPPMLLPSLRIITTQKMMSTANIISVGSRLISQLVSWGG